VGGGSGCRMISLPICGALPTIIGGFPMDGLLPTMLGGLSPLNGGSPPWCVGADIMFIESMGKFVPFGGFFGALLLRTTPRYAIAIET
jgi:hypothetical protein